MTKKVKVKELEEDGRCYVAEINVNGHLKMTYDQGSALVEWEDAQMKKITIMMEKKFANVLQIQILALSLHQTRTNDNLLNTTHMKTLDEIISRNDYERVNSALKNRVNELAEMARRKMNQLGKEEIYMNSILLSVRTARANSGFSEEYLAIYEDESYNSLEHQFERYVAGDFTARIVPASSGAYLDFLNNARAILNALDELETEKAEACQKALDEAKGL